MTLAPFFGKGRAPAAPGVCAYCGGALGRMNRRAGAKPACSNRVCQARKHRERVQADPVLLQRRREADRARNMARRRQAGAVPRADRAPVMGVCTDCRRRFPAASLEAGTCGGPWCPSGGMLWRNEDDHLRPVSLQEGD